MSSNEDLNRVTVGLVSTDTRQEGEGIGVESRNRTIKVAVTIAAAATLIAGCGGGSDDTDPATGLSQQTALSLISRYLNEQAANNIPELTPIVCTDNPTYAKLSVWGQSPVTDANKHSTYEPREASILARDADNATVTFSVTKNGAPTYFSDGMKSGFDINAKIEYTGSVAEIRRQPGSAVPFCIMSMDLRNEQTLTKATDSSTMTTTTSAAPSTSYTPGRPTGLVSEVNYLEAGESLPEGMDVDKYGFTSSNARCESTVDDTQQLVYFGQADKDNARFVVCTSTFQGEHLVAKLECGSRKDYRTSSDVTAGLVSRERGEFSFDTEEEYGAGKIKPRSFTCPVTRSSPKLKTYTIPRGAYATPQLKVAK